jgi:hypothetical protein
VAGYGPTIGPTKERGKTMEKITTYYDPLTDTFFIDSADTYATETLRNALSALNDTN